MSSLFPEDEAGDHVSVWDQVFYPITDPLAYRIASIAVTIGGADVQLAVDDLEGFASPTLPLLCAAQAQCEEEAEYVLVENGSAVGIACLAHGPEASLCKDCRTETFPSEHYMVHDELWPVEVGRHGGMLCIGCLEVRLGRELNAADFTAAPINIPDQWTSDRMKARLHAPGAGDGDGRASD